MRVLVIGGTGFIGPRVVRRLAQAGHKIVVFHRGKHLADLPAGVRSITDPRAGITVTEFPGEVFQFDPQLVLHMIAMGEHDGAAARKAFSKVAWPIWPPRPEAPVIEKEFNFAQNVVYDTGRIRSELGFAELFPERKAMIETVADHLASQAKDTLQ